ncbi:inositol monophosphatase family protein [Paenarthrobacter sp. Z7-10]|uniref:inositol monophosphatase family protein n=1 Tax=Paenarthrobacter sp. Z7-10 TaxID=2787635 RepID=UPI003FA6D689
MLALRLRAEGLTGERKTSVSDVVTAADHAAERYIVDQLRRCRPDDGIRGEEGASHAGGSGRVWVIDPVDGTYNFLSGFTYWCSALALKVEGSASAAGDNGQDNNRDNGRDDGWDNGRDGAGEPRVLLGAIYQPQEDKLWLGGVNCPATLNGQPIMVAADLPLAEISAGTYLHPTWLVQNRAASPWRAAAAGAATLRMLGSGSCDLARVADGTLGCWFQHSCPEWDWLPGKAIVGAAGGSTAAVRVNELDWFIAGTATAVAEVAAALRRGE